ncbi:MAG: hypothetical protein K2X01_03100 [Cyanobacteria bacterium]|nr:hypothetical protein [Cyanobacteriota bacterium]
MFMRLTNIERLFAFGVIGLLGLGSFLNAMAQQSPSGGANYAPAVPPARSIISSPMVHPVNWNSLQLNADQNQVIQKLDSEWQSTYGQVYPQIQTDKAKLRTMLNDPNAQSEDVMKMQDQIHRNEQTLRNEAARVFMKKKETLDSSQKQMLKEQMCQP